MSVYDKRYTYNGKTQDLYKWSEELGITPNALYKRLHSFRWDYNRVFSTRSCHGKLYTYNGKTQSMKDWERDTGISRNTLWKRTQNPNFSPERIFTEKPQKRIRHALGKSGIHNKRKKDCIHPNCFKCPYADCVMD